MATKRKQMDHEYQMIPVSPHPTTTEKINAPTSRVVSWTTILDEGGSLVRMAKDFVPDPRGEVFRTLLEEEIRWTQETVSFYGKTYTPSRRTAAYGDPGTKYKYSGTVKIPDHWTPNLQKIKEMVETATGQDYNFVLCNLYPDGDASIGYHCDDETDIFPGSTIASISLGAERDFLLKKKDEKDRPPIKVSLPSGSLLTMEGSTQKNWKHSVPVRKGIRYPRINLTFRRVKEVTVPE